MNTPRKFVCGLCFLTGLGILFQWVLVWIGAYPVEETVPGYTNYFMAFQLADMWIISSAILAGLFIILKKSKATLFGISLGSAMVFFGLYALLYDFNTRLSFDFSAGELFGKSVTAYNITAGAALIAYFWNTRDV